MHSTSVFVALVCGLLLAAPATPCAAQLSLPAWMQVQSSTAEAQADTTSSPSSATQDLPRGPIASQQVTTDEAHTLRALERSLHQRRRRARWLMTIGSGTVAGSVVGLGMWQLDEPGCTDGERLFMPAVGAGAVAVVGAGILTLGILRTRQVPLEDRRARPVRGGRLAGVIAGALLTTAISSFVPLAVGVNQWLTCANS